MKKSFECILQDGKLRIECISTKRNIFHFSLFIIHFTLVIIHLFITPCLLAYSLYDIGLGTEIQHHDTRATAMGSSGVAAGFSLFDSSLNPANLYFLNDDWEIAATYSLIKNSENRAIPLWNFFDSYVDESTYARNEHFYNELAFGVNFAKLLGDYKLSTALIYRPVVNFGANYSEEVRSAGNSHNENYPPIYAKNFIEASGLLNSYSLLLNWGMPLPFDNASISVGAELSYLNGKNEYERAIYWTDTARNTTASELTDYFSKTWNEIDGIGVKFGLSSQITERWRVGAAYTPKVSLNTTLKKQDASDGVKYTVLNSPDYVLPSRIRMGVMFAPRNPFRTNFQADFEIINYSEIDKFYDDGYAIYVGMEHYVGRAMPLRMGFSHRSAKQDKSISLPIVSAGTSFPIISGIVLDLAAEYGKREYSDLDLFPDGYYNYSGLWPNNHTPQDRGWESPDSVSETFWKVLTTVRYRF